MSEYIKPRLGARFFVPLLAGLLTALLAFAGFASVRRNFKLPVARNEISQQSAIETAHTVQTERPAGRN